jgi:hypothetical protein
MLVQDYNPSYLGGRDQENCSLRPAWAKISKTSISTNKWSMVEQASNPSYTGGKGRGITVQGWPLAKST